ncbi:MAG: hypothetical protein V1774_04150 [Candidatus Eisenbacteria bacterium]
MAATEIVVILMALLLLGLGGIPLYSQSVRHARLTEALQQIDTIIASCRVYASTHSDEWGNPLWPPAEGEVLVPLRPTRRFRYVISEGAGRPAGTEPLTITAIGRAGTRVARLRISVMVPDLRSAARPPYIVGA